MRLVQKELIVVTHRICQFLHTRSPKVSLTHLSRHRVCIFSMYLLLFLLIQIVILSFSRASELTVQEALRLFKSIEPLLQALPQQEQDPEDAKVAALRHFLSEPDDTKNGENGVFDTIIAAFPQNDPIALLKALIDTFGTTFDTDGTSNSQLIAFVSLGKKETLTEQHLLDLRVPRIVLIIHDKDDSRTTNINVPEDAIILRVCEFEPELQFAYLIAQSIHQIKVLIRQDFLFTYHRDRTGSQWHNTLFVAEPDQNELFDPQSLENLATMHSAYKVASILQDPILMQTIRTMRDSKMRSARGTEHTVSDESKIILEHFTYANIRLDPENTALASYNDLLDLCPTNATGGGAGAHSFLQVWQYVAEHMEKALAGHYGSQDFYASKVFTAGRSLLMINNNAATGSGYDPSNLEAQMTSSMRVLLDLAPYKSPFLATFYVIDNRPPSPPSDTKEVFLAQRLHEFKHDVTMLKYAQWSIGDRNLLVIYLEQSVHERIDFLTPLEQTRKIVMPRLLYHETPETQTPQEDNEDKSDEPEEQKENIGEVEKVKKTHLSQVIITPININNMRTQTTISQEAQHDKEQKINNNDSRNRSFSWLPIGLLLCLGLLCIGVAMILFLQTRSRRSSGENVQD